MAEGKGFEPLNAFDVSRFQDARLRPLGQPSIDKIIIARKLQTALPAPCIKIPSTSPKSRFFRQRQNKDKAPCFSRPPRYDRFDIPPCIYITHCLFMISYFLFFVNIMLSIYSMELKKLSIHEISYHCKVFNFTTFYIKTYFILKELFSNVKIKIRIFSFSSV